MQVDIVDTATHEAPPRKLHYPAPDKLLSGAVGKGPFYAFIDITYASEFFTGAIGRVADGKAKIVQLFQYVPPFDSRYAIDGLADVLREFGIKNLYVNRHAGRWGEEQFQRRGFKYIRSQYDTPDDISGFLVMLDANEVEPPMHEEFERQLRSLRAKRGGEISLVNVVAGLAVQMRKFLPSKTETPPNAA